MTLGIRRRKHLVTAFVLAGILSATMIYSSVSNASKPVGRLDRPIKNVVRIPARVHYSISEPQPYSGIPCDGINSSYFDLLNCMELDVPLERIVSILKNSSGNGYVDYSAIRLCVVDVYGNPIYVVDNDGDVYDGYKHTHLSKKEMRELCSALFHCHQDSCSSAEVTDFDVFWRKHFGHSIVELNTSVFTETWAASCNAE